MGGSWRLAAKHRSGSLKGAVSALRQRNLVVGFGILALLGVSAGMTVVWAERVRSVGRLQMEFAAGISHELRTPLATIRTAAHNIASGVVKRPEEVREYAGIVQTEGRRLSAMVDQVIQFAQTESGRRAYDRRPVETHQVVERALAITFSNPEEGRSKVHTHIDPNLPPVLADETALAHAVGNLVTNALKYGTTKDPVVIDAIHDPASDQVQLSVHNKGSCIDAVDIPLLFEPFYRGSNAWGTPGSGLGLNLVRKMMEGQRGHVTVSSKPEQGTTFTLHIPVAQTNAPKKSEGVQS